MLGRFGRSHINRRIPMFKQIKNTRNLTGAEGGIGSIFSPGGLLLIGGGTYVYIEGKLENKIDNLEKKVDAKIDNLEKKVDAKIDKLESKIDALNIKIDTKFERLMEKMDDQVKRW